MDQAARRQRTLPRPRSRRHRGGFRPFTVRLSLALTAAALTSPSVLVSARVADDRLSRFLYADDPSAEGVVADYQLHTAPSGDYEREDAGDDDGGVGRRRPPPGSEYEEQQHVRPYFLETDVDDPRVVQFYSPWCGHCQRFRPRYVELASEVRRRHVDQEHNPVSFHAVSCSAHHWVCEDNGVKGFPTVRAYRAGKFEGTDVKLFSAEAIAEALGIALDTVGRDDGAGRASGGKKDAGGNGEVASAAVESGGALDIRGASIDVYRRTKNDLYKDAALSFTHALRTEVFPPSEDGSAPLSRVRRDALSEWIDLLYWTLPPTWQLHTLIHDVRSNLDAATESRADLVRIVDSHSAVVHGTDRPSWTDSCAGDGSGGSATAGDGKGTGAGEAKGGEADAAARGDSGYVCGLWALFHIMSVGVSERHSAVLGARDRVSTAHAARTLRDYVEHFGASGFACGGGRRSSSSFEGDCRAKFLDMFDSCGFNHCRRFKQKRKRKGAAPPPAETWVEFSLWLWEVHNDIRVSVARKRARVEGREKLEADEAQLVLWPKRTDCTRCWRDGSGWDREAVLSYLRTEYWPGGVQNFRYVVLAKKDRSNHEYDQSLWSRLWTIVLVAVVAACTVLFNKWQKMRSGRHKKFEEFV